MLSETYTPRTWRTNPLHLLPPEPFHLSDPKTKACLDWIFVISSLNFSFWSEKDDHPDRYGVKWRESWTSDKRTVWTGYWSLVAAINRGLQVFSHPGLSELTLPNMTLSIALDEGMPITDPHFYSSDIRCPDSVFNHVFRPAIQSSEPIPLLKERVAILRQNGKILCKVNDFVLCPFPFIIFSKDYGGSFLTFIQKFQGDNLDQATALDLVLQITKTFPTFRDQINYQGSEGNRCINSQNLSSQPSSLTVIFWKRAQILVAETWAAFYPASPNETHPILPGGGIHKLTMFADYRVPQILHHLQILHYPPSLVDALESKRLMMYGSSEEVSIRVASILAVERVRDEIINMQRKRLDDPRDVADDANVSSVLIDFYLWDLAIRLKNGEDIIEGIEVNKITPAHRTRSIWY
jgi:Potential Queuosine, Q, salvage protein family